MPTSPTTPTSPISLGELEIDRRKTCEVRRGKELVGILTTKKVPPPSSAPFRNPGRVYTRLQLLDTVWGYGYEKNGA